MNSEQQMIVETLWLRVLWICICSPYIRTQYVRDYTCKVSLVCEKPLQYAQYSPFVISSQCV